MKKLILLLSLILSTFVTKASHIMGGMLTVSQTSQDSTSIGAYFIMDQQGIIPPKQYVGQYEMVNGFYSYVGSIELSNPITSTHQGTYLVQYTSDYLNLDSNQYRFIATHCCWGLLNNSTNSNTHNFVISVDYWHIPNNSSVYMENPMWVNMQKDSINTMKPIWGIFNCFFSQSDNDSVSIEQTELYSGYANGVFVPQVGQSPSNMYVGNDSITSISSNLGPVGNGFEINEYRNGNKIGTTRIQWTFKVLSSTLSVKEITTTENMNYEVYDWMGRYIGKDIKLVPGGFYVIRYTNGASEKIYKL